MVDHIFVVYNGNVFSIVEKCERSPLHSRNFTGGDRPSLAPSDYPCFEMQLWKSDDSLSQQVAIDKIKLMSTGSPSSTARYSNPLFEQLVTPRGAQLTAARNELAAEAGTSFLGEGRGGIFLPSNFFKCLQNMG